MKSKRTYVTVLCGGKNRDLFSVEENRHGELTILPRIPGFRDDENGKQKIVDHHITVHNSLASSDGGFQVKLTTKSENGHQKCFFHWIRSYLGYECGHIYFSLGGGLGQDQYISRAKRGDRVIKMFDQEIVGSVFYMIVVSRAGLTIDDLAPLNLTVERVEFTRYSIFVLAGIFPTPRLTSSAWLNTFTRVSVDGKPHPLDIVAPLPRSPTPKQLVWMLSGHVAELAILNKHMFKNAVRPDETPYTLAELVGIRDASNFYVKDPSMSVTTDIRLMLERRKANLPTDIWIGPALREDYEEYLAQGGRPNSTP